ncbi:MAG: hypothetical protein JXA69_17005 [Phycisphaerae bacterium]|nr:hypothetical protein [Phycisphaerae bacterium]
MIIRAHPEYDRLRTALGEVMDADSIPEWLQTPNEGLGRLKPIELIERGAIDRIWETIFFLRSGVPS